MRKIPTFCFIIFQRFQSSTLLGTRYFSDLWAKQLSYIFVNGFSPQALAQVPGGRKGVGEGSWSRGRESGGGERFLGGKGEVTEYSSHSLPRIFLLKETRSFTSFSFFVLPPAPSPRPKRKRKPHRFLVARIHLFARSAQTCLSLGRMPRRLWWGSLHVA